MGKRYINLYFIIIFIKNTVMKLYAELSKKIIKENLIDMGIKLLKQDKSKLLKFDKHLGK